MNINFKTFFMRNSIALLMAMAFAITGCEKSQILTEKTEISSENRQKVLFFTPSFGLETDISSWKPDDGLKSRNSRAAMEDYADSLLCVDYMDGKLVQKQAKSVSDLFPLTLYYGLHDLRFLGHSSTDWELDEGKGIFRVGKVTETFLKCVPIEVDEKTDENLMLQMDRVVTKLTLLIEDAIPENVAEMELTMGGHMAALDMATGLGVAGEKKDYSISWKLGESYSGMEGLKLTLYSFCEEGEFEASLRVTARDAAGKVIQDRMASGIPLLKNRCTVAKGRIFSHQGGVSFTEPGEWIPQYEIDF